ncbi:MAG: nucleotidyltransferase domain-containing protein [Candidatus Magasanikbacteria bacterium]
MVAPEKIQFLHKELQNNLPEFLVLLGGSYARNLHTENSDIDFFLVPNKTRSIINIIKFKTQIIGIKEKYYKEMSLPIHIHPCFPPYIQKYLSHISGKESMGNWYSSPITYSAFAYNTYKLYLKYSLLQKVSPSEHIQKKMEKCAQLFSTTKKESFTPHQDIFYPKDSLYTLPHLDELSQKFTKEKKPILLLFFFSFLALRKKMFKKAFEILFLQDIKKAEHALRNNDKETIANLSTDAEKYFFWWFVL